MVDDALSSAAFVVAVVVGVVVGVVVVGGGGGSGGGGVVNLGGDGTKVLVDVVMGGLGPNPGHGGGGR